MFLTQNWQSLENVQGYNMRDDTSNYSQELVGYFDKSPAICSGIGLLRDSFGQQTTTNTFIFNAGVFRFLNRVIGNYSIDNGYSFADYAGGTKTITTTGGTDKYVCAKLTMMAQTTYIYQLTADILTTTKTLAQITADTTLLPIFILTDIGGSIYTVTTDSNCAFNYGDILAGIGVDSLNGETGDLTLTSTGGTITITEPTDKTINLETSFNAVPKRMICYQYAGDPQLIGGAEYRVYTAPVTYTPTPGSISARVIVIGGSAGGGAAAADVYIQQHQMGPAIITVGAGGGANSSSFGLVATAQGGLPSNTNLQPFPKAVIGNGFIGLVATGSFAGGGVAGEPEIWGSSGFSIGGLNANINLNQLNADNFPGAGGNNGAVWIFEW